MNFSGLYALQMSKYQPLFSVFNKSMQLRANIKCKVENFLLFTLQCASLHYCKSQAVYKPSHAGTSEFLHIINPQ
jgi:hypothetical protein